MKLKDLSSFEISIGFNDVAIKQKKNICTSRLEVNTTSEFMRGIHLKIPLIASNMSTVVNVDFCCQLHQAGALGILHRAMLDSEMILQTKAIAGQCDITAVSVGVGKDQFKLAKKLIKAGASVITIDIAHGYCDAVIDLCKKIKQYSPTTKVIVGNTTNKQMLYDVNDYADAVKVGVGQGCFAAGTRILMADATYKNIESIERDDFIINMQGRPARVKRAFCTGERAVIAYKQNNFYTETICTPDHSHYVGDLNTTTKKTIASRGYKKLLLQKSKTTPRQSKIKWMPISELKNGVLLFPEKIQFKIPRAFTVKLPKRYGGNWRTGSKYKIDTVLTPSYELGYIFGTFLGDGNAHCRFNKRKNSHSGNVNWAFGINEKDIALKLQKCIYKTIQKKVAFGHRNNVLRIYLYYKPLADFLNTFGKRTNKHLPKNLLVNDKKYLMGIWDGLIDSDGHIAKDGRKDISNSSASIIELAMIIHTIIFSGLPNVEIRKDPTSPLVKKANTAYRIRTLKRPERRIISSFQLCKIIQKTELTRKIKVYDLEIDDNTHSFIANNTIVHNSVCETSMTAGCTEKQWSVIFKMKELSSKLGLPIISDGGIRLSSDFVKAIGAGANSVMAGSIFARCPESAAPKEDIDGICKHRYSGMASRKVQEKWRGGVKAGTCTEGKTVYLDPGESYGNLLERYIGALRSGITYAGGNDIKSFQDNCEFVILINQ